MSLRGSQRHGRTLWIALAGLLFAATAHGHAASDSYLTLATRAGGGVEVRWEIALRDLDYVLGLDANGDGAITWGEVRTRTGEIEAYALRRLALRTPNRTCPAVAHDGLVARHGQAAYYVLLARAACGEAPLRTLDVDYTLLFDADTTHRGLLKLTSAAGTVAAVFGPEAHRREFSLDRRGGSRVGDFATFVRSGVLHILDGWDHLLFLLSLLLPAVVALRGSTWEPASSLRPVALEVLRTVTAFTVAHSITFLLASLGMVELPTRWVESAIAASVVLASLNNVFGVVNNRRWVVAFGFGLVHGFGFASLLIGLDLPAGLGRVLPLLGFNLGVELGQLAVVALGLPVLYLLRGTTFYRRAVLGAGSCAIAAVGAAWFVQRAFGQ